MPLWTSQVRSLHPSGGGASDVADPATLDLTDRLAPLGHEPISSPVAGAETPSARTAMSPFLHLRPGTETPSVPYGHRSRFLARDRGRDTLGPYGHEPVPSPKARDRDTLGPVRPQVSFLCLWPRPRHSRPLLSWARPLDLRPRVSFHRPWPGPRYPRPRLATGPIPSPTARGRGTLGPRPATGSVPLPMAGAETPSAPTAMSPAPSPEAKSQGIFCLYQRVAGGIPPTSNFKPGPRA